MTKFLCLIFLHAAWNLSDLFVFNRKVFLICVFVSEVTGTEMTWTEGGLT